MSAGLEFVFVAALVLGVVFLVSRINSKEKSSDVSVKPKPDHPQVKSKEDVVVKKAADKPKKKTVRKKKTVKQTK